MVQHGNTLQVESSEGAVSVVAWYVHRDATIKPLGVAISREYIDDTGKARRQRLPSKYLRALVKSEEVAKNQVLPTVSYKLLSLTRL